MAAESSGLPEYPTQPTDNRQHLEALIGRFGHDRGRIRSAIEDSDQIGDPSTADLDPSLSRVVDQRLRFVRPGSGDLPIHRAVRELPPVFLS